MRHPGGTKRPERRPIMPTTRKTAIVMTVAAALIVCVTALAERDRPAPPAPRELAAKGDALRQYVRLHQQAIQTAADPVLASAIAIGRIKDIAVKHDKLAEGAAGLQYVAAKAEHPAVRRLALLTLSELSLEAGKPTDAIKALAAICLEGTDDEEDEEDDEVGCQAGPCEGCPRGEAEWGEREEMEQRHRQEIQRREREEMERMDRRGEMDRMGEGVREGLQRRSRELDEKARQIEQRMEELKRWAQELEQPERESRRP